MLELRPSIKLSGDWKKDSFKNDPIAFKSSTNTFAHWVFLQKKSNEETFVWLTPEKKVSYQFDTDKNCNSVIEAFTIGKADRKTTSDEWFDDRSLETLLNTTPNGVIFIWSPHMTLSLKAIPELKIAAEEIGLPITWPLDPQANIVC